MYNVSAKNVLLVGKDTTEFTGTDINNMAAGQICLVNKYNTVLNDDGGAADVDNWSDIRIVQKTANGFRTTDVISRGNVVTAEFKGRAYVAPTEQITCIGYNGTSGTIVATDETNYMINFNLMSDSKDEEAVSKKFYAHYVSDTTATAAEIAAGLMLNGEANLRKHENEDRPFKIEMTSDGTPTQVDSTDMIKLTKGSKTVTAWNPDSGGSAGTLTIASDAILALPSSEGRSFTFTALDAITHQIYIGTTSYSVADANTAADGSDNQAAIVAAINADTTNACNWYAEESGTADVIITFTSNYANVPPVVYNDTANDMIAVSITTGNAIPVRYVVDTGVTAGASFTLDVPWQGETCYVSADSTSGTDMYAATLASITNYGLKVSGLKRAFNATAPIRYTKTSFSTNLNSAFSTTPKTATQAMSKGSGTYQAVAQEEWESMAFQGMLYRNDPLRRSQYALETSAECGGRYGILTLRWVDESTSGLKEVVKNSKTVRLAFNDTTSAMAVAILAHLNDWLGTSVTFA